MGLLIVYSLVYISAKKLKIYNIMKFRHMFLFHFIVFRFSIINFKYFKNVKYAEIERIDILFNLPYIIMVILVKVLNKLN